MSKLKIVQVGLSNIEAAAGRAAAVAQVWARQIGRTHASLYEALGQCLILYRAAKRDRAGFLRLCEQAQFQISVRARSETALGAIRLAFDPTPFDADARCRYSLWSTCLLALDEIRPVLRTAEAARAHLERNGIRKLVEAFRDQHRPQIDKPNLIREERLKDQRIGEFMTRAIPVTQIEPEAGLRLLLVDRGRARRLDLDQTMVRSIVLKAIE